MRDSNKQENAGVSSIDLFVILLQVAFIVLKLCGVINWAWKWVLSPLWISCAIAVAYIVFIAVKVLVKAWREKE